MTSKVYRSAQGKMVDLGTIMLQNEHVRAVGNMKVNARGDKIDSLNQVLETRTERIQRQNDRTSTAVSSAAPQTSSRKKSARPAQVAPETQVHSQGRVADVEPEPVIEFDPVVPPAPEPVPVPQHTAHTAPVAPQTAVNPAQRSQPPAVDLKNPVRPAKSPAAENVSTSGGGLAGAIARSREIKQELDRTRRQKAQDSGLRKI